MKNAHEENFQFYLPRPDSSTFSQIMLFEFNISLIHDAFCNESNDTVNTVMFIGFFPNWRCCNG